MTESAISAEDAEEFTQSLGQVVGGAWRQIAWASRMGIPEALGLATQEWVEQRLGGYVRLSVSERREAVRELTGPADEGGQGMTQREAAEVLGVNPATVNRDIAFATGKKPEHKESQVSRPVGIGGIANATLGEFPPEPSVTYPRDSLSDDDKAKLDVIFSGILEDEIEGGEPEASATEPRSTLNPEAPAPQGAHVGKNSGDNEWYTPDTFIKAATAVMGAIDLDPASSDVANEVVGAAEFYTEDDDGLAQPWAGRVWMNPPYAQPLVDRFCTRLAREYRAGSVTEACVLVNNATETNWFQEVLASASAVCFPRGRVKFWHPTKEAVPLQGQAVIYLGPRAAEFKAEFLRFGPVGMFLWPTYGTGPGSSAPGGTGPGRVTSEGFPAAAHSAITTHGCPSTDAASRSRTSCMTVPGSFPSPRGASSALSGKMPSYLESRYSWSTDAECATTRLPPTRSCPGRPTGSRTGASWIWPNGGSCSRPRLTARWGSP